MTFVIPFRHMSFFSFDNNNLKIKKIVKLEKKTLINSKNFDKKSFLSRKTLFNTIFMEINKKNNLSENNLEWLNSMLSLKKNDNSPHLKNLRKIGKIVLANTNFPSTKDESWRFTPLKSLFEMRYMDVKCEENNQYICNYFLEKSFGRIVFIDGVFSPNMSFLKNNSNDFFLGKLSEFNENKKKKLKDFIGKGESGINGGFFSILNMACIDEIVVLFISSNIKIDYPIQIIFAGSDQKKQISTNQKLIVLCEKFSTAKIIEQHIGAEMSNHFDNSSTNIIVEKGSKIDFVLANQVSMKSALVNSIHVELQQDSSFNFLSSSIGGFFSRVSLGIDMNGINSNCAILGTSLVKGTQISDFHSRISHNYPKCKSNQLHKNLVSEKGKAIFAGKIQVHNGASETESEQLCKTLLLSSTSTVDSMPILEINNENVKCTHGSTVSDLDDEQIFYFQSRGIPLEKARFLLTLGFAKEIIQELPKELFEKFSRSINSFF